MPMVVPRAPDLQTHERTYVCVFVCRYASKDNVRLLYGSQNITRKQSGGCHVQNITMCGCAYQ